MKTLARDFLTKRLVAVEITAFVVVIVLIWLDEVADIPFLFFGAEATPVNWRESLFESLLIIPICLLIVYYTKAMFRRLKYLEGFLPICASCKKIRDDEGNWQQMEEYIRDRSEAEFSHGICPQCARKLYPDLFPDPDKPDAPARPMSKTA